MIQVAQKVIVVFVARCNLPNLLRCSWATDMHLLCVSLSDVANAIVIA